MTETAHSKLRLDKWLWAARFFKTRALATEAVNGGKVHLNGERARPAHAVRTGDVLVITRGVERFEVCVQGLSDRRGPASQAQTLYGETAASRERRAAAALQRKLLNQQMIPPAQRPDKKQRRRIIRFKTQE